MKENLLLGANPKRARDGEAARREQVLGLFPRLRERAAQIARTMSGGEQQMLAIGRALMSNPDILLLDEPSLGLSPLMVQELFATLLRVREAGVGLLLVEQNAQESLRIADRGYVLENGIIVGHGTRRSVEGRSGRPARLSRRRAASRRTIIVTPRLKEKAMHEISLLLESKDVPASNGATFDRLNPVTGDIASRAAAAQIADAKRAADTAAAAFPAWSATGPNARRAILLKAADLAGVEGAAVHRADGGRNRRDRRLGRLQRPSRRRHAARGGVDDHADFRRSDPLRQAGLHRDGDPRSPRAWC